MGVVEFISPPLCLVETVHPVMPAVETTRVADHSSKTVRSCGHTRTRHRQVLIQHKAIDRVVYISLDLF
jgi:hypothetical protein